MSPQEFIAGLRREFPDLVPLLDDDEGLFYLQVSSFARHTQAAIDDGDRAEVQRHFEFARKPELAGDREVQNALGVAYKPLDENARSLGVAPRKSR